MIGIEAVEAILTDNHGVLDARAHRDLRTTICRLIQQGLIVRVFPGIYVRAGTEHLSHIWLAAACAWSPEIVLSGETAVSLLTGNLPKHVKSLGRVVWHRPVRTRQRGMHVRKRAVARDNVVSIGGIRVHVATAAAVEAAGADAGRAIDDLLRELRIDPDDLKPHLGVHRHTPGNANRRRVVAESSSRPYSVGERELHRLLLGAGITEWVANTRLKIEGQIVRPDVLFPESRLIIEFDGRQFHGPATFEADRRRQNLLVRNGYQVLRFTWAMIRDTPDYVISTVRESLRRLSDASS